MTEILVPVGVEEQVPPVGRVVEHPAWPVLKDAVEEIRPWQSKDGSIDFEAEGAPDTADADLAVRRAIDAIERLAPLLPHDAEYHEALVKDLRRWADGGFQVPDFLDSLLAFQPAAHREDGLQHLVVFPMYTQNGNPDRNFEAVVLRMVWPEWLAELERTRYDNPLFCGITFEDFTAGYDTNSAVLFPETIAVREAPERFSWGGIFCDREAARFRAVTDAAVDVLGLQLPEDIAAMVHDQERCEQAFVLWDMVHDRTHSHGDLPFDPFMIKQRMPFFLYSLEELRCDLTAFRESVKIERQLRKRADADEYLTSVESQLLGHAKLVQYAVIFDRIFRFAITGSRVRNYDGLGGQLLFAWLHRKHVLEWTDVSLSFDWDAVPDAVVELGDAIDELYWKSIDRPKTAHWLAAYDLVRSVVTPNPASVWAEGLPREVLAGPPKGYTDLVMDDEFPLSMFYEALDKKMKPVIESTVGITAASA
jgi:hypothetical protein